MPPVPSIIGLVPAPNTARPSRPTNGSRHRPVYSRMAHIGGLCCCPPTSGSKKKSQQAELVVDTTLSTLTLSRCGSPAPAPASVNRTCSPRRSSASISIPLSPVSMLQSRNSSSEPRQKLGTWMPREANKSSTVSHADVVVSIRHRREHDHQRSLLAKPTARLECAMAGRTAVHRMHVMTEPR